MTEEHLHAQADLPTSGNVTWLPIDPFNEYLRRIIKTYSYSQLSELTGFTERQIKRWLDMHDNGKEVKKIKLENVDKFLVAEGSMSLYELYPE